MIKELEVEFKGTGEVSIYDFKQIKKSKYGYIYEVYNELAGKHYEVFKRKENTLYNTVTYPSSKVFGRWAWTYKDLEGALWKYETFKIKIDESKISKS